MPPILQQPVQRLVSLLHTDTPRRLIALAGLPGAGKSTLTAHLAAAVNAQAGEDAMQTLGMDGFHLTLAQLRRMPHPEEAIARRGAPWTFDPEALAQRLRDLRAGAGQTSVPWPDFQHELGDPVEDVHSVPASVRLVLVEGLYLLYQENGWDAVGSMFEERWYLDTPLELAIGRLTQRHMTVWGLSRQQAEGRIATNDRHNAEIVLSTRSQADWRLLP